MECGPSDDNAFGPLVRSACRFDFTLLFEETILRLGPAAVFLLLGVSRIYSLVGRTPCLVKDASFYAKIVVSIVYAVFQLVHVVYAARQDIDGSDLAPATQAAAVVCLAASLLLCVLSPLEHLVTVRPSTWIQVYLFFTALFDAAYVRTLWLIGSAFAPLATASLAAKVVFLAAEAPSKRRSLVPEHASLGREDLGGVFTKTFFLWLWELLLLGNGTVLSLEDLYPLGHELLTSPLTAKFEKSWGPGQRKSRGLFFALVLAVRWHIVYPILPRLCQIGFTFAQPLMLSRVVDYVARKDIESPNIGYGLIGAYAIVYTGIAVSTAWFQYLMYRFITMFRGILISLIYEKTLRIPLALVDNSDAVTLMSTDVERIVVGLPAIHEVWAAAVQVAIAAWLLHGQVGFPFFLPIVLCFLCAFLALALSVLAGKKQVLWLDAIKERLAVTSTLLKSMKGVKMLGLSRRLQSLVHGLRSAEISAAFQFRALMSTVIVIAFFPQTLAPVLTFGYSLSGITSDSSFAGGKLFTTLLLLKLLTQPLTTLFQAVPTLISALGCIKRIETYACSEERVDKRSHHSSGREQVMEMEKTHISGVAIKSNVEIDMKPLKENEDKGPAVHVLGAQFGWSAAETPLVRNVTMDLEYGQLTLLVGPAGAGKSTLIKGLLGETPLLEGQAEVSDRAIAFCDQTPWLTNGTIQENILGVSSWDASWYKAVVHACVLDEDLVSMADGDQSILGSNGTNLSGGQKQRVAIARAVYTRRQTILLDDVLSGLDRKTEQAIFNRLLAKDGLLRKTGAAVLLATHSVHHLPRADMVISLQGGTITEQGSFEELRAGSGYFSKLDLSARADEPMAQVTKPPGQPRDYAFGTERDPLRQPGLDVATRQVGQKGVYTYYFRASGLANFAVYFGLQLAWATLGNFPTVWLQWWSNALSEGDGRNGYYYGGYVGFQAGYLVVLASLCVQVLLRMLRKSGKQLQMLILESVIRAPMSYFNRTDAGITLNIFSQDLQILDSELPFAMQNTLANALSTIAQAIIIMTGSYMLGLCYPPLAIVFYYIQRFYLRTSRQLRLLDLEAKSPLYTSLLESLSGVATIRAFGWEETFIAHNTRFLDQSQRPFYLLFCLQRWLTLVLDLVVAGLAVVLLTLVTQLRNTAGNGFTGVALFNVASLAQTMTTTVTTFTLMEVAIGAVARIKSFREQTPTENLPGEDGTPPEDWPSRGRVEFKHITVSYSNDGAEVLKNLSLNIQPGEKIAICGRTGSGKSTAAQMLFRMLERNEGTITVDNIDISTLPRNTVRERLVAIPQEPFFVSGSVRLNLDAHDVATDEQLREALRSVGLGHILEAPGGLEAQLNPDSLSHGQRQMFCLARATLGKRAIVVLDEATSSVDIETDKVMQKIIRTAFAECTIIAVAHRLETVLDFDKIAVLDQGRLVEFGAPAALLGQQDSAFKSLYEAGHRGHEGRVSSN